MPLSEINVVVNFIFPKDGGIESPLSWFAFCDDGDGNYIAADLATASGDKCKMFDCFHESFPDLEYCRPISDSFTDFLDRLLRAGGFAFWLG